MSPSILRLGVWLGMIALAGASPARAAELPRLVSAGFFGGAGNDSIQHVAIDPEGSIWVAGNSEGFVEDGGRMLPFPADPASSYGRAFVAKWDRDAQRLLAAAWAPGGGVELTTVMPAEQGVFVAGYATPALEAEAARLGGAVATATRGQKGLDLFTPAEHFTHPKFDVTRDERGTPFVARLSPALDRLEAFTFLEGWQTRWHVPHPLGEDWTQKVLLAVLPGGDLVAVHDGGYNRIPEEGKVPGLEHFYRVPDRVSRLAPDLKTRHWVREVAMNPVNPEVATGYLRSPVAKHPMTLWKGNAPWPWSSLGNTHCLDLAVGREGTIHLAGYSSSRTSQEPWWAPFLVSLHPQSGDETARHFTHDPMSGREGRLNGLVSDSAIVAVSIGQDGALLFSGIADGGNSVLRQHPLDFNRPPGGKIQGKVYGFSGRTLFWGIVGRLDPVLGDLIAGAYVHGQVKHRLRAAWATAIQPLPGGRAALVGRNTDGFATDPDAWGAGPGSFLRIYDTDFATVFSTGFPAARLLHLAASGHRVVAVGNADSSSSVLVASAFQAEPGGGREGYVVVAEVP